MFTVRSPALSLSVLALVGCGSSTPDPVAPPEVRAEETAEPSARSPELTATEVVRYLRGNETELRRCFFANPSLRGAARFSWKLDVTGKVQSVRRESSTLGDERVEQCISERLAQIRFGDLEKPSRARWTFVFRLMDPPPKPQRGTKSAKKKKPPPDDPRGVVIDPSSSGSLPSDAIDNVVEAGYPLLARCYRDGVSRNDSLDGTARLNFVIGTTGAVTEVSDAASDMTDRQVVDCIAEGFYGLHFPAPQHGTVRVLYRIGFDAG